MTLTQFIKSCDSAEAAAAQIGVKVSTLWRWLNFKKMKMHGNNARRLRELGITKVA